MKEDEDIPKFFRPEYTDEWIDEAIYETLSTQTSLHSKSWIAHLIWSDLFEGTEIAWQHVRSSHSPRWDKRQEEEDAFNQAFDQKWAGSIKRLRKAGKIFHERNRSGFGTGWGAGSLEAMKERRKKADLDTRRLANIREDFARYKIMVERTLKNLVLRRPDEPITLTDGSTLPWQQVILEGNHLHHVLCEMTQDEWEEIYKEIYDAGSSVLALDPQIRHGAYGSTRPEAEFGIIELPKPSVLLEIHKKGTAIVQKNRAKK